MAGVAFTRNPSTLVHTLRSGLAFRLRLRQTHPPEPEPSEDEDEDEGDLFVWDVSNPFAPPDPSMARLRSLIQAEIEQMRRYESIGPLQSLPDQPQPLNDWYDDDDDDDDDYDYDDDGDNDGDDEDDEESDAEESDDDDPDKPNVIALPRLLHTHPLRFLPSPNPFHPPSPPPPPPPPPPPSRFWSPFFDTNSIDKDPSTFVTGLAQTYNDLSEAEERARKAKRDAYRSRLKALAVLGPEAASAIGV